MLVGPAAAATRRGRGEARRTADRRSIAACITDLTRRMSGGDHDALVVVIVPGTGVAKHRCTQQKALSMCGQPPIRTAVWS
jgi:hypothetical protein